MAKVEISIRRKRPIIHATPKHRGPLDIKTEPDYLKRRLKKGGVIKFYDLGQKSDGHGGWVQNNFTYDPGLMIHVPPDTEHASDEVWQIAPVTLAKQREFEASILGGVAPEDFETTFRQIKKSDGNSFPLTMNNAAGYFDFDSPEWIEEGLKVKASDLISPDAGSMFVRTRRFDSQFGSLEPLIYEFYTSNLSKFTIGPSYSSPAVPFIPKVNDSYFLMPFLCASFGYSAVITGFHLSTEIYLNNYYHIQTRNFDNHDYIAGWAWVDAWENSTPSPQWNEALALHHAIGTRTYTVHYSPRGSLGAIQASLSSGGAFPTFPSNATTNAPSIRFTSGWGGNASSGIFAGMLYGIVKQGETLYYLWGTLDR